MSVDEIFEVFNRHQVDCILIGGMNFLLNHEPELTYDVDLWIRDTDDNLQKTTHALCDLEAQWGATDSDWRATPSTIDWLKKQSIYCLTTRVGALDLFRDVKGLENQFEIYWQRSTLKKTSTGISYRSLDDEGMLRCQEALPPGLQKLRRMETLKKSLRKQP